MQRIAAVLLLHAAAAGAFDLSLELDSIRHPAFEAERIRMQPEAGGTLLTIGVLRVADRQFSDLRLKCREFKWADGDFRCAGGTLKVGAGDTAAVDFHYAAKRKLLELTLRDASLASLVGPLSEFAAWQPKGMLSGSLRLLGERADFDLSVSEIGRASCRERV